MRHRFRLRLERIDPADSGNSNCAPELKVSTQPDLHGPKTGSNRRTPAAGSGHGNLNRGGTYGKLKGSRLDGKRRRRDFAVRATGNRRRVYRFSGTVVEP